MIGDDGIMLPSGLIVPRYVAEEKARQEVKQFTGVSLFSGAGGFDLGFVQAGCQVLAAVEYDCTAVHTYMSNLCRYGAVKMHFIEPSDAERMENYMAKQFKDAGIVVKDGEMALDGKLATKPPPMAGAGWISHYPNERGTPHIFVGDIRKLTGERLLDAIGLERGQVGCVFGGPPCQGYSHGGKRNVMDPRNSLVFEWARMVVEIQPTTCIMENVAGITSMVTDAGIPVLDELAMILERGDFNGRDFIRKMIENQTGLAITRGKQPREPAKEVKHEKSKKRAVRAPDGDLFA